MIGDVVKLVAREREKLVGMKLFGKFEEAVQKVIEKGQVGKEILEDELNLISSRGAMAELAKVNRESDQTSTTSMVHLATERDAIDSALQALFHAIDQQHDLSVVSSAVRDTMPKVLSLQKAAKERLIEKVEEDKTAPAASKPEEERIDTDTAKVIEKDLEEYVMQNYNELVEASNDLLEKGYGEGRAEKVFSIVEQVQDISDFTASLNPTPSKRMSLWLEQEPEPEKPRNDQMVRLPCSSFSVLFSQYLTFSQ